MKPETKQDQVAGLDRGQGHRYRRYPMFTGGQVPWRASPRGPESPEREMPRQCETQPGPPEVEVEKGGLRHQRDTHLCTGQKHTNLFWHPHGRSWTMEERGHRPH